MTFKPMVYERGSAPHVVAQAVGYAFLAVGALIVMYKAPPYYELHITLALTYALGILGLNIVTGLSGQISLGHSAFFGLGAYTSVILVADHGWPFLLTIPVAAAAGFVVGFVTGVPALRIRGLYLSLVTLAVAIAFPALVKKFSSVTGGSNGKNLPGKFAWRPPSWLPGHPTTDDWTFLTVFVVTLLMYFLASNLIRSRVGRGLVSLRDNEIGAAVSGVHPAAFKTMAFAVGSMYAAVAGALYGLAVGTLSPDTLSLELSIKFIAGLVVGGIGTLAGAVIGGGITEFLPYYTSKWLPGPKANMLLGGILVVVIFLMPGGIVHGMRQLRGRIVQFIPRLPGVAAKRTPNGETTASVGSKPSDV